MREMALITSKGLRPSRSRMHVTATKSYNGIASAQWDQEPNQSGRGTCFSGGVPPCGPSGDDRQQKPVGNEPPSPMKTLRGPRSTAGTPANHLPKSPQALPRAIDCSRPRRNKRDAATIQAPRQAVHVVNEIDRVGDGHNPKQETTTETLGPANSNTEAPPQKTAKAAAKNCTTNLIEAGRARRSSKIPKASSKKPPREMAPAAARPSRIRSWCSSKPLGRLLNTNSGAKAKSPKASRGSGGTPNRRCWARHEGL